MPSVTEKNKAIVIQFNREFIEKGNMEWFGEFVADDFFNHSAAPGQPTDKSGVIFFGNMLRQGFPDIKTVIHEQVAEGDLVTTRKSFHGTHLGEFMGIAPTNKKVEINVIDMIRLRDGKYVDHWGLSNFATVLGELAAK